MGSGFAVRQRCCCWWFPAPRRTSRPANLTALPGARDTLIGNANTDGTAWMHAVAGPHPHSSSGRTPTMPTTILQVAEAVNALGIRYVLTSRPVVRGFTMPDGLVSLGESESWAKIYDNGEARIYEWRGGAHTS